jgi:hypothetical protein
LVASTHTLAWRIAGIVAAGVLQAKTLHRVATHEEAEIGAKNASKPGDSMVEGTKGCPSWQEEPGKISAKQTAASAVASLLQSATSVH